MGSTVAERPLFGRERELATLDTALGALSSGGPSRALCLRGEAGVGKTRLAEAAAERARALGARVAWAACWPEDAVPDLWPWSEILAQLGSALPRADPALAPDVRAFEQAAAALGALRTAITGGPTLVVLDDVQWADHASLRLLSLLLRAKIHAPFVLVLTERPESEARAATVAQATRGAEPLEIGGLDERALADWLARLEADPTRAARLRERTGGNPLFVGHVLSHAGGPIERVPSGVRPLLEHTIAELGASARRVVGYASLAPRPVSRTVLASLPELAGAELESAIAEASRVGILSGERSGLVGFAHELAREVARDRLGEAERRAMHLALAAVLERARGHASATIRASDVAHHLVASAPAGDAGVACEAALEAAREAEREGANERVADWLEHAAALAQGDEALSLLVRAAVARAHADQGARGRALAEATLARARKAGRSELVARAALAMGAEIRFGVVDPELVARLEEAAALASELPDGARASVMARLASARQPSRTPEREHALAREAIALARATGDPRALATVLDVARPTFRAVDDLEERRAIDEETLALAERLGDRPLRLRALQRMASVTLERGALVEGEALLTELRDAAHALGDRTQIIHAEVGLVTCAIWRARWDEAERRLEAHAKSTEGMPVPGSFVSAPAHVARVMLWRAEGRTIDPDPAWPTMLGEEGSQAAMMTRMLVAATRARAGKRDEAVRSMIERLLASGIEDRMPFVGLVLLPDLVARHGLVEHAARLAEKWKWIGGRLRVTASLASFDGATDRALGQLLGTSGSQVVAREHLEHAIALEERVLAPAQAALSRLALGELGGVGARAALDEARVAFERLRMDALATRARALAVEAPATAALARTSAPPRVDETITLVAEGETWVVRGAGEEARLVESHGLRYLAHLVERAGTEVHVLELVALVQGDGGDGRVRRVGEAALPALDARAKRAYRERVEALRGAVAEAELRGDADGSERARAELDAIAAELARALGLGGRDRGGRTAAERARVTVTQRIRDAIKRIADVAPRLGHALGRAVRTGVFCSYDPGPG